MKPQEENSEIIGNFRIFLNHSVKVKELLVNKTSYTTVSIQYRT
jgi:hypothetical protein